MADMTPEEIAKMYHTNYERLAPEYGYGTRPETATDWDAIPDDDPNKLLMIAVAGEVLDHLRPYLEERS